MRRYNFRDYPYKSPCNSCGTAKYGGCVARSKACDDLHEFLAERGDWVTMMNQNLPSQSSNKETTK